MKTAAKKVPKAPPVEMPPQETEHVSVHNRSIKTQVIISVSILIVLIAITVLVILYGKGYRLFVQHGEPTISKTGILNLSSDPTGAQVYIDGHLTTATNNSLNLNPGNYTVKIVKDGFLDWQKDFLIKREVVSNADATLFPKAQVCK